eukprot:CAMPEP_0117031254 /NCGR_PEP_ID=MMETSP0472-20121206/22489_1 /TAXON_ID=693140 ORGANISM="Tiarina fusus, Strain LIS" /NCGR_SAMPLE_ID=MMETSP0472 /ASSEMBLY_ACC=CAM_ASM_000603 /LENGTH=451 /DNA_ID=CAMNT_0004739549 /DNA_START=331 /DNA_END=1686 /DNA_ORIENTATION=-
MGQTCSTSAGCGHVEAESLEMSRNDSPDPVMYDLMRKSIAATCPPPYKSSKRRPPGQHHLLFKQNNTLKGSSNSGNSNNSGNGNNKEDGGQYHYSTSNNITTSSPQSGSSAHNSFWMPVDTPPQCPTRLLIRRRSLRVVEEGGGTHIYAIRYPEDTKDAVVSEQAASSAPMVRQEQCPPKPSSAAIPLPAVDGDVFTPGAMNSVPRQSVVDWVTVSEEHHIYIADVGLTASQCDHLVTTTEQACRGQYAAYTYAKQTLGCREFPILAQTSFLPVHTVVHAITQRFHNSSRPLQLDDREPHIVKYDVTKKERQKLDMHTDKSEWTFLIALSNGCGVDYEGGGTYFECLDATVHIQRGHALIFPGKLRHCGQKITSGLRFLLVGFLVDKSNSNSNAGGSSSANNSSNSNSNSSGSNSSGSTNHHHHHNNSSNNHSSATPPSPPGVPPVRQFEK